MALAVCIAAAAVVAILSATAAGAGCTDTYVPSGGGDWSIPGNWDMGHVPGPTDVACWSVGATVVVSTPGDTADSIVATGDLQITGGVLALTSTSNASQVANLSLEGGGELDGPSGQTLTVTASLLWGTSGAGAAGLNAASGAGMAVIQTGGGTFTIGAAGVTPTFGGGSITTASPVSIANSTFASSNSPTLTTTSTITLGAGVGDLGGSGTTFSAAGVVNSTGTTPYGFGANALTLTGGTTTVATGSVLDSGLLSITGGTLQDDGTVNPTSTTLTSGGALTGTGTVNGSVTNTSGTVSPGDSPNPGALAITGAYSQGAGGSLAIVLNSTTPGTGFSKLTVTGAATLGGNLALSGTYVPTQGNTFNVLSYGSLSAGTFTITGSNATAYTAQYAATGVTLAVTPSSCPATNFDAYTAATGTWSTGSNWSQNAPPSGTQVACWAAGTTVTVSSAASVDSIQAGGDLSIAGGVLTLTSSSNQSSVVNLFLEGGGELDGPSGRTLTVSGNFDWGGSGSGTAALNAASGSGLAISQTGGGTFAIGAATSAAFDGGSITTASAVTITNLSVTTTTAPTLITTSTITLGAGVVVGGSGATFTAAAVNATGASSQTYGFGTNALKLTGATTTVASGNIFTSGVLSIAGGTLQDDGTVNPTSTTLTSGGTLTGTGTVSGAVTNTSGTVSPGDPPGTGTLAITGAYSQGAGGTLAIVLNSPTPGTGFSKLTVTGAATLGGNLALSGTYAPTQGNTFNVLTYASLSAGTFTITGSNATAYTAQYAATGVTMAVTPSGCPASNDVYIGASGNWSTGSSWSKNAPPSGTEVACWAAGTTVTVSSAANVDSIQAGGDLNITGGIFTLTSTTNQSSVGNLSLEGGGQLDGPSGRTLTVSGNFDWGGSGSGPAVLNGASGTGLAISQTGAVGTTLTIDGTTSAPAFDGGSITTSSPVTISNSSLTYANTPTLTANAGVTFSSVLVSATATLGTITTTAISNTGSSSVLGFNVALTAGTPGTISGSLTLAHLSTVVGTTLPVSAGATLSVENGTIAGTINGGGTFTAGTPGTGGTTTVTGNLSTAAIDVLAGTLDLNAAGTTTDLSLTGGGDLNSSTGATLTVSGAVAWSAGAVNAPNAHNLAINQTGTGFSVSGTSTMSLDGGSITTVSPVSITATHFSTASPATLTTASAITLGSAVTVGGSGATFTASGVNATGSSQTYGFGTNSLGLTGGTTAVSSGNVLHTGPLSMAGGTLVDDGSVTSTAVSLGGGTLEGTGTVNGPVNNVSGIVSPGDPPGPGALTVTGAYAQGAAGTLAIELDGTTPGTGFSQLQVGGATTSLAGTLSLTDGSGFLPALGDTFKIIGSAASTPSGVLTISGPGAGPFFAQYNAHDVTLAVKSTPANISAPAITGTPSLGQTLSCSAGRWSANPSAFAYVWNRDGSAIPGATQSTYVVVAADLGHSLTCAVTASNSIAAGQLAISPAVEVPAPPAAPSAPQNSGAPVIAGSPTPGNQLSCSKGTWSGAPTSFKYQWERNGTSLAGATGSTYTVLIADEASSLACAVTASNAAGAGATATSAAIVVARAGTLSCPKPTGRLGGTSLGRLALGQTRAKARRAVTRYATSGRNVDNFCLYGGWGIHAGYASSTLLHALPARQRARLLGRIVLVLTGNPYYALDRARPGMALTAVPRALHVGKAVHIGANAWYLTPSGGVLKVRGGIIQEVGIANKVLTRGLPAQRRLLASFNAA